MKNKSKVELLQIIKSLEEKLEAKEKQIIELSEEKLASKATSEELMMDSSFPYQSLDHDGNILIVNQAWCDLLEYSKEEILGKNFATLLSNMDAQSFAEQFKRFRQNGLMIEDEIKLNTKSGQTLNVLIDGRAVYNKEGIFCCSHCILKDITEKNRLKQEIQTQANLFKNTFDMLPIGVAHITPNGIVLRCNPKYADILGTTVEDLIGRNIWEFDLKDSKNDIKDDKIHNFEKSYLYITEKQKLKLDGTKIWIRAIGSAMFNENDELEYIIGVIEDITDAKSQINSLHLYKSIIENARYGVAVCDLNRRVLFSNSAFAEMHQNTKEDTIGKTIDIYHSKSQMKDAIEAFEEMSRDEHHTPRIVWHVKTDGTEFPMLMNGGIVKGSDEQIYITTSAIDITQMHAQSKQLEESQAKYHSLFSQSADCIYLADYDTLRIIEANNALLNLTGYTNEEITKLEVFDLIDATKENILQNIKILDKQRTLTLSSRYYISKKGDRIPVEINSSLIRVNNVCYISTIARDTRDRKKIENELRERENFIRSVTDNVPVIIFVYDIELQEAIFVNNQLSLQLGYEPTELTLSDKSMLQKIVHKDDLEIVHKVLSQSIPEAESNYIEFRLKHKAGGYHWFGSTNTKISLFNDEEFQILGFVQSIDAKKRYSKALMESERMYKSLAESLPDTIMRFDKEFRHLYVSENVSQFVDINAADMLNKTHSELGFPEKLTKFWERHIQRVFDSGKAIETEFTLDYNNFVSVIDWRLMPEKNEHGETVSVLAIARNINDLRDTERDYQRLFNEMTSGFAVHEIMIDEAGKPFDYRFIVVNKAFEEMTGLRNEDIKGKTVKEVLPKTENYWIETYGKVAITGETLTFENYAQELDTYYEVTAYSPLKYQFATIIDDITEAKKIQNLIKDQEEKYRIIVENQSDYVVKLDANHQIIYANPKFHRTLKLTETEVIGHNFFQIIPKEHRACFLDLFNDFNNMEKYFASKECKDQKTGTWINWTIKAITQNENEIDYFIAIGHDITEIKKGQDQIEKLNSELEEKVIQRTMQLQNVVTQLREENEDHKKTKMQLEVAKSQIEKALNEERELNQMKTRFISMVSHEYRTPLTVILSSSYLIDRLIKKGEELKVEMHLEKIQSGVKQMTNLLEDVIAVGKSEEGVLLPKLQYFDFNSLINTIIDEIFSIDSRMHKISLKFFLQNEIIFSDPKMMRQILNNLLTNSCKYSKIGTEVVITVTETEENLVIDVTDQGLGISEEDMKQLFTPFFRNKQHIGAIPGSGLGLTIVKKSIEALNGRLLVKSKLNEGSTFSVLFPLRKIYPDFYKD